VIGAALFALWRQRDALVRSAPRDVRNPYAVVTEGLRAWHQRPRSATMTGVVFGDSVLIRPAFKPLFVPLVSRVLLAHGVSADVLDMANRGFSAFQFYYAVDDVLGIRPLFAIIEINLCTFAPDWYENASLRTPQLTARLSPLRALDIRSALATQGLSIFSPLIYRAQEHSGTLFVVEGLRIQVSDALERLGTRINSESGLPVRAKGYPMLFPPRLNPERANVWYGHEFVDSPTAQVLRALVRALQEDDVAVLAFIAPINTEQLTRLGFDLGALWARIDRLRDAVGLPVDAWVHTSQLMRSADFLDVMHLQSTAARERLAEFVGAALVQKLHNDLRTNLR
jgi:hypothetical protein